MSHTFKMSTQKLIDDPESRKDLVKEFFDRYNLTAKPNVIDQVSESCKTDPVLRKIIEDDKTLIHYTTFALAPGLILHCVLAYHNTHEKAIIDAYNCQNYSLMRAELYLLRKYWFRAPLVGPLTTTVNLVFSLCVLSAFVVFLGGMIRLAIICAGFLIPIGKRLAGFVGIIVNAWVCLIDPSCALF